MSRLKPGGGPMRVLRMLAVGRPMPEWKIGNVTGHGRPVYGAIARLVRLGYVEAAAMDDICSLYKHWQITAAGRDYLARVDGES